MSTISQPPVSTRMTLTDRKGTKQPKIRGYSDYLYPLRWGCSRHLDDLIAKKSVNGRPKSPQFKTDVRMQPPFQIKICEGLERSPIFDPLVEQRFELCHDRSGYFLESDIQGNLRWDEL